MKPLLRILRAVAIVTASTLGAALIRVLGGTLRVELKGLDYYRTRTPIPRATVFCFWHDQLLLMILALIGRRVPYGVLISQHPDGDPVARAVARLGLDVIRGSSTRGGLKAIADLAAYLKGGGSVVFTPDGPRGPRHRAGEGALVLARRGAARVVPVGAAVTWRWRAGSWDRLQVPLPFARVTIIEGEPVEAGEAKGARDAARAELERKLTALTAAAEAAVGRPEPGR